MQATEGGDAVESRASALLHLEHKNQLTAGVPPGRSHRTESNMPNQHSKRYLSAVKVADLTKDYPLKEAVEILTKFPKAKFDETIERSTWFKSNRIFDLRMGGFTGRNGVEDRLGRLSNIEIGFEDQVSLGQKSTAGGTNQFA